jgi:hypothetical protein
MTPIETIKTSIPLAPYVAPLTNGLKPTGRGFLIGRCPFHQSPTDPPNKRRFWVDTSHNTCGCFVPRCPAFCDKRQDPHSKPLDIINFYALYHRLTPKEAISQLLASIGDPREL